MAYFPFMSTPDTTVKRKSGFLFPTLSSMASAYGVSVDDALLFQPCAPTTI